MIPENSARSLEKFANPLSRIADSVGRAILALMVLLITLDVVLRYFFNRPIKGSYELVEFMMVLLVFLGLAFTQTKKNHVSITLFTGKLSPSQMAVIGSVTYLLCLIIFSMITWRCLLQAEALRLNGTSSDILFIPNFPFMWVVVFGSALLSLVFLIDFLKSLDGVLSRCKNPWLWFGLDGLFIVLLLSIPSWLHWLSWDISRPVMGLIGIAILLLLLFSSMPIGPVMALIGYLGFSYLVNPDASLTILGTTPFRSASSHAMTTIPLFVLMGVLCFHAELSKDVYTTIRNWVGKLPGGLAMSTVGGCAGFAAVSGSSLATAITMGTIALPEMRRYKYNDGLACGCVAAGGSIGILIPPSIAFIIYATITEESIGRLFMAGVIPGLMEAVFYMLAIYIMCKIWPKLGPPGPSSTWREKIVSLKDTWGILVLFTLVIGGIYAGIFTPTEAAGVGAFGALLLGILKKKLNKENILQSLADASKNTAMLMLMLIGADIFSYFLTMSQIPFMLSEFVVGLPVSSAVMVWAILLVYIVLGCIMPIIPAIILTVPIFLPVVTGLGYDPIWFGVIVVTMAEMGQITPPVGINVFALSGVAKDVPLGTIFKGIFPFLAADIVRVALVFFFPALALWLPSLMG
ncbi:MAG: TRAP transporter large permease subunit [Deltaproteobacteria bacterium]|nr:TRAP transporter large permease subunit [Deltaproteobacteria bacterium]